VASVSKDGQTDVIWVNYDLTKADKAKMAEVMVNEDDVYEGLQVLIRAGHRVTLGWDERAKAFAAYAFPDKNNPLNKGMGLTARSRSIYGALMGLVFRHCVVFDGTWRTENRGPRLDDDE
jgi:hypothetical protein